MRTKNRREMENVQICYNHLSEFKEIDFITEIPDNARVTVYCEGSTEKGFMINVMSSELGLNALIARKWILHEELERLTGCKII